MDLYRHANGTFRLRRIIGFLLLFSLSLSRWCTVYHFFFIVITNFSCIEFWRHPHIRECLPRQNFIAQVHRQRSSSTMERISRLESLGPNLQTRLEALEAAMGVRLNLAKAQGRHSLSNSKSHCLLPIFDDQRILFVQPATHHRCKCRLLRRWAPWRRRHSRSLLVIIFRYELVKECSDRLHRAMQRIVQVRSNVWNLHRPAKRLRQQR